MSKKKKEGKEGRKEERKKRKKGNEIRRWMIIRKVAMENERNKACSLNIKNIYVNV